MTTLDDQASGAYIHVRPDNSVFYVGKGTDKRMYVHYNTVKRGNQLRNRKLANKLKKLIKEIIII